MFIFLCYNHLLYCIVSWSDELFIVYLYAYMLYDIGK